MDKKELDRRMIFARKKAARAWCAKKTKEKVVDPDLAEEFAKVLVKEMYLPRLGCATTKQLLDEIYARSDLDYSTIKD